MTAIMRDTVSPDLRQTLRALSLGQMLATLPDRLTLARQQKMTHADFLELVPIRRRTGLGFAPRSLIACGNRADRLAAVRGSLPADYLYANSAYRPAFRKR